MKKLTTGKTVTFQLRKLELGEEMEITFSEKLPNRVSALCSNLKNKEEQEYQCFIDEDMQVTIVTRIR